MKQFATLGECKAYIKAWDMEHPKRLVDFTIEPDADDVAFMAELVAQGYDLDDLIADGHGYDCFGHTNNGWAYRDELDPLFVDSFAGEIRER